MTVEAFGCAACGERRRDIKRLVSKARHEEWAGRPVAGLREQIRSLKAAIADCSSRLHLTTEPLRQAAEAREPV